MKNSWLMLLMTILMVGFSSEALAQKDKSVKKATKKYTKFVKDKAQGKEKVAQKRSSDPATVTREQDSIIVEEQHNPMRDAFEQFKQQATKDYENFRDKCNQEYAEFMKQAWKEYGAKPPVPRPVEKDVPPVVIKEEDVKEPIESKPVKIEEEIVTIPAPEPQPVPVAPIREQPVVEDASVSFSIYGTNMKVRFSDNERFSLPDCRETTVSDAWKKLSGKDYNNTIRDCLALRIEKKLSDWAYLQMLGRFAKACLGEGNEATMLTAYIFCQSGYRMRLATFNGKLLLLFASEHIIFDLPYYALGDETYYVFDSDEVSMRICDVAFPKEKSLSLYIPQAQEFDYVPSEVRHLKSKRYPDMDITSQVNKNVIAFCNDYPKSSIWNNVMTRWAMLANMPMQKEVKETMYPQLREKIKGLSEKQAVERLLNWVQTSLVYEYDDKVWGGDRAFFPEETLYYPYADCEDRSIFLSRIVRDLLGLKTILIYYPGHLAMAIGFSENVAGDYIMLDGKKFVVCDPTYIGAPVGETMPGMDNSTANVILLDN